MGKMKQQIEQDGDIQTYKQEWVGLTDKEIYQVDFDNKSFYEAARMIEEMLKWRNT